MIFFLFASFPFTPVAVAIVKTSTVKVLFRVEQQHKTSAWSWKTSWKINQWDFSSSNEFNFHPDVLWWIKYLRVEKQSMRVSQWKQKKVRNVNKNIKPLIYSNTQPLIPGVKYKNKLFNKPPFSFLLWQQNINKLLLPPQRLKSFVRTLQKMLVWHS